MLAIRLLAAIAVLATATTSAGEPNWTVLPIPKDALEFEAGTIPGGGPGSYDRFVKFQISRPYQSTAFLVSLDRALGVLLLAGFMNFFNFMDGINGLAGAEAVAIAGGYLLLTITTIALAYAPLAAALLGASIGFLVWNAREKALVFLGDVGSVPLGLLTGALMIDLAVKGYWPAALILPSYFLADASITLLKRLARGEKIWEAHKSHAYQRAAQAFGAHLPVVWRVSAANTSLIAAALWSVALPLPGLFAAAAVLALLFAMLALARAPR